MRIVIAISPLRGGGSGLTCLRQLLLKAFLPGLARPWLTRDFVMHLRPSCYVEWDKVLLVHASLTSKIT
ncbi:hypothetical protein FNJ47_11020 [Bradyrhizobium sp. UFLA 03-164]|uniref:Uncharacterized protein n=1 Tax=Bradyrhizobium uaiense TaxID=2594946 RepID=A0A6P1BFE0_9BRAD|nr:hypothetical protein [Bradyrhizobium uaiense]